MNKNNLNSYDFIEGQEFIPKTYGVIISPDDNIISVTGDGSLLGVVKLDIENNVISLIGKDGTKFSSAELPLVDVISDAYYDEERMSLIIKVVLSDGSEKDIVVPFNDLLEDYAKKADVEKNTEAIVDINQDIIELKQKYLTKEEAENIFLKKTELPEEYQLPVATSDILGGIKIGNGLTIDKLGSLSVTNNINWDDIIDKPEAFNPIEHIHSIYEINNLQDELDSKADKTDIDDMLTKTEAQDTYQVKGNYLTEHQDISQLATKQEVTEGLATKQDKGNYITLETADGKYQIKGDYATKSELANKVDTSVYTEDKITFALKSELPDVSNFITNTVDNLVNYYKKSEIYTKSEIDGKINAITTINFEVVGELPQSGEANKIYLVPNTVQSEKNVKDEYIWVDGKWEIIGSTQIDLTNYYTKNEVDTKLSTKVDLSTYNSDKENFVLKIDLENYITISDAENIYATKSELESKVNNSEIIDMATKTWVKEQNYISSVNWDDINDKPSEYQPIKHEHIINDITDLQEYLSQFTTKTELSDALSLKQDKLISNNNIKTINGESLLGSGNIIIENNEGIPEAPTDNKKYVRQNTNWVEETIINTENFITKNELDTKADKTDIDDMLTKTEAQDTYQVKGNYLTNIPEEYITENELLNKDYTTKTWVQEQGYLTTHQDISNLATKDEVSVSLDNKVDKTVFEEAIGMLKIYYKEGYSDSDGYINEEIVTEEEGFQNIIVSRMFYDGNMWCNCCSYKNIHDEYKVITGGPKYQTVLLTSPIVSYTIPNCLYRVFYIKIPV